MKKRDFSFQKLLENKKAVLIFSLMLAVVCWFMISVFIDPESSMTISDMHITIPESLANNGMCIISGEDQDIEVKIDGKRYRLGTLTNDDIIITPQISNITEAGEATVRLLIEKADPTDEDFTIVSAPTTITLTFDHISEKAFNLEVSANNVQAESGYVKETPTVSPTKLTLTGSRSEIENIARCVVVCEDSITVNENYTARGDLVFYNHSNQRITPTHVSGWENTNYDVTIAIYMEKSVPLLPSFTNVPNGIDPMDYISLSQSTINVRGPKNIIDTLDSIPLDPIIDFRDIDIGSVHQLVVSLPSTVIVNTNNLNTINLTVSEDGLSSKRLNIDQVLTRNIPSNYNVRVITSSINNIKLVGNTSDIQKLSSLDLIAYVDFKDMPDLTVGRTSCAVMIYSTGSKKIWAVGDYEAVVDITEK